ncbi:SGNH/GDSL hydrolase family protein [Leptolyngbya ohadii]|uniref:SGNH/GDSL hydrolase family protein n=1 Tax=Leptolyngbya ohadii TaxID=1962290 RepID=UPI0019D434A1|nr:SGNH/GDSL hydrolase family protein [Leptolyngbya ohadii]
MQDKRSLRRYSLRRASQHRLRAVRQFLQFSSVRLRWSLLPRWVFISLAINGFLGFALLTLLRSGYLPISPAASANQSAQVGTSPQQQASIASANSPADLQTNPRHQLSYEQWIEQLGREATAIADQSPKRLTVLAGDSISLWFPGDLLPKERVWLNQGISGETSAGLLKRLDLFDETAPETIFVMIGINDVIKDVGDRTILANQQEIVRDLKEAHPKAQIVLQSILPHAGEAATWEGRDRLLAIPNTRIQELNRQLEAIAREEGIYFLNLYPLFADSSGDLRMEYSTDGLHLNPRGYEVWSVALQVYGHEVLEPALGE